MAEVIRLLVEAKAELNHQKENRIFPGRSQRKENHKRQTTRSAFHLLAKYFYTSSALFDLFIRHEADVNETDHQGKTVCERVIENLGRDYQVMEKIHKQATKDQLRFESEMTKLQTMYQFL